MFKIINFYYRISSETFKMWANCCIALFPTESLETFYNKTKEGIGGVLYDKYLNTRRMLKNIGMIGTKSTNKGIFLHTKNYLHYFHYTKFWCSISCLILICIQSNLLYHVGPLIGVEGVNEENIDAMMVFLKNHMEPFSELEPKWKNTVTARAEEGKNMAIDEYFQTYKGLKRPQGYLLVL